MYPKPHGKLLGRQVTDTPEVGIPLALDILRDTETHRNDTLSAVCYLGYRVFDGTYKDVDYIWPKILEAYNMSLKISNTDKEWYRSRWVSSYSNLQIYFRILVFNEKLPVDLAMSQVTSNHAFLHPPQLVNVMRAYAMLIMHYYVSNNVVEGNKQLEYMKATYKKSISLNNISDLNAIWEITEATACLMFIMQVYGYTGNGRLIRNSHISHLIECSKNNKSYGCFYRCLDKIYNQ